MSSATIGTRTEGVMQHESLKANWYLRALVCLVALCALFGCAEKTSETVAVERHGVVTFPVTITLSTPSPVSPLDPVVGG